MLETLNFAYARLADELTRSPQRVQVRGTSTIEKGPYLLKLKPNHRLVTAYGRPINVAFAVAEFLWIVQGRNDVAMLEYYNSKIKDFSDDGESFNAPYGYRLRNAHGYDQIEDVIKVLQDDPYSRRATMVIWHPSDKGYFNNGPNNTKDRACNVLAHLMIRKGKLQWLQVVRSNDIVLGMPYNFMQWISVQEYMAARLGVGVGSFSYCVDSLHAYENTYYNIHEMKIKRFDLYSVLGGHEHAPISLADVDSLCRYEQTVRAENSPPLPTSWEMGLWATQIGWLLYAHHMYKAGANMLDTCTALVLSDPVYALAQARFYWKNRWSKDPGNKLESLLNKFNVDRRATIAGWFDA